MKYIFTTLCILQAGINLFPQNNCQLQGSVYDKETNLPLQGATIYITPISKGLVTDADGSFKTVLECQKLTIEISFLGYKKQTHTIDISNTSELDFHLIPDTIIYDEVEITEEASLDNIESIKVGTMRLTSIDIEQLPAFMGTPDPVRTIRLLPGISSASDGNSGFHVRGSDAGHNLILIDNVPVYNPSHIMGFFSIFNNNTIRNIELIKSGMPANYGTRLSSILDIETNNGNNQKHEASANLGLISSDLYITGPIVKSKLSFHIAGRRTYLDEVIKPLIKSFISGNSTFYDYSKYHFFDFNFKLRYKVSPKNFISLTHYTGSDIFSLIKYDYEYKNRLRWGNNVYALNWNYLISDKSHLSNTIGYSTYDFDFTASRKDINIELVSSIEDINYKLEYTHHPNPHNILSLGFDYQYHRFSPNNIDATANEADYKFGNNRILYSHEGSIFGNYTLAINHRLTTSLGIRLSGYMHTGPYDEFTRNEAGGIDDTISYATNSILKKYSHAEPRINLRYRLTEFSSFKFTCTKNYQYVHLISSGAITLPTDIWIPSTKNIKPQSGNHFSFGYFFNLLQNQLESSIDFFYKDLDDQIELVYGIINDYNDNTFEEGVIFGEGRAYGFEFYSRKNTGKTTGWISYSLSRTTRIFDEINDGKIYPAKFDRLHDVSLVLSHSINDRISVASSFIFTSGNAMTLPEGRTIIGGNVINLYGKKNSFRMPAYHRLDVSASYQLHKKQRWESVLTFSVFNLYNRANPYYIYFEVTGDVYEYNLDVKAKQISMFPILPSINWIVTIK